MRSVLSGCVAAVAVASFPFARNPKARKAATPSPGSNTVRTASRSVPRSNTTV